MATTVAFTDLEGFVGTGFPNMSKFEDEQLPLETEINSEPCFGDIVGKSQGSGKCWNR